MVLKRTRAHAPEVVRVEAEVGMYVQQNLVSLVMENADNLCWMWECILPESQVTLSALPAITNQYKATIETMVHEPVGILMHSCLRQVAILTRPRH